MARDRGGGRLVRTTRSHAHVPRPSVTAGRQPFPTGPMHPLRYVPASAGSESGSGSHDEASILAWLRSQPAGVPASAATRGVRAAIANADAEGRVWTPLIDTWAASGMWPSRLQGLRARRLAQLAPWLEAAAGEADFGQMLESYASPDLFEAVCRWGGPALGPSVGDVLNRFPSLAPVLCARADLTEALLAPARTWAVARLSDTSCDPETRAAAAAALGVAETAGHTHPGAAIEPLLAHLVRPGGEGLARTLVSLRSTPEAGLQAIYAAGYDAAVPLLTHPAAGPDLWRFVAGRLRTAEVDDLLGCRALSAQLLAALAHGPLSAPQACRAARHPAADASVWLALLQRTAEAAVFRAVADHPAALGDPGIRAALCRSDDPAVIAALLQGQAGVDASDLLGRLAALDPGRTLAVIEGGAVRVMLPRSLVDRLVLARSPAIRSRAMRAVTDGLCAIGES